MKGAQIDEAKLAIIKRAGKEAFDALPVLEQRILELRYGLTGERPLTFENVGFEMGLSTEWTRALAHRAVEALRSRV